MDQIEVAVHFSQKTITSYVFLTLLIINLLLDLLQTVEVGRSSRLLYRYFTLQIHTLHVSTLAFKTVGLER